MHPEPAPGRCAPPLCAPPARDGRPRFLLLVADPDPGTAADLCQELTEHQIDVVTSSDPADALLHAGMLLPDAVLTAAYFPPLSGAVIARIMHERTCVPTLIGATHTDGDEATAALAAGATACVARPYRIGEVLPMLRAIRPETAAAFTAPLQAGPLRLDPATMEVHLNGERVRLPMREFELLHLLMSHANRVVTRPQIVRLVWRGEEASNTINVHIRRLRARLGDDPHHPTMILTIRGMGYRLVPPGPQTTNS